MQACRRLRWILVYAAPLEWTFQGGELDAAPTYKTDAAIEQRPLAMQWLRAFRHCNADLLEPLRLSRSYEFEGAGRTGAGSPLLGLIDVGIATKPAAAQAMAATLQELFVQRTAPVCVAVDAVNTLFGRTCLLDFDARPIDAKQLVILQPLRQCFAAGHGDASRRPRGLVVGAVSWTGVTSRLRLDREFQHLLDRLPTVAAWRAMDAADRRSVTAVEAAVPPYTPSEVVAAIQHYRSVGWLAKGAWHGGRGGAMCR